MERVIVIFSRSADCELMRPNSAGYGGEYGDVWVDIRHQFVGMASAGHTGESDSWLSCHPSNGWL